MGAFAHQKRRLPLNQGFAWLVRRSANPLRVQEEFRCPIQDDFAYLGDLGFRGRILGPHLLRVWSRSKGYVAL